MAEDVPVNQNASYWWARSGRGTRAHLTPEQYDDRLPLASRRYGTALNVWQMGKIMYSVILHGRRFYALIPGSLPR